VPGSRRIYVHIGEPKTGTSFFQHALWSNRARLAAQGIVLPGYSHGGHARASQDLREVQWRAGDPADPWTGEWDVLTSQTLRAPDAAVIPNELLAACNPRQADRAVRSLHPAEVHIVVTVRDFATLLPADGRRPSNAAAPSRGNSGSTGSSMPQQTLTGAAGAGATGLATRAAGLGPGTIRNPRGRPARLQVPHRR
jgi:hypothetical protein